MESVPRRCAGPCFRTVYHRRWITRQSVALDHRDAGVERLGESRNQVASYYLPYTIMALFILLSLSGLACLHRLRRHRTGEPQPDLGTNQASTTA